MQKIDIVNREAVYCNRNKRTKLVVECKGLEGYDSCKYYSGKSRNADCDLQLDCNYPKECCESCHWGMVFSNFTNSAYKVFLCCFEYIPKQMDSNMYQDIPSWCPGYTNGKED